jgi:hypothetical protein
MRERDLEVEVKTLRGLLERAGREHAAAKAVAGEQSEAAWRVTYNHFTTNLHMVSEGQRSDLSMTMQGTGECVYLACT